MIDQIEILNTGHIQVREILKDEDGQNYFHRYVLAKGDDISTQPDRIKSIAAVVWIDAVVV